MEYDMEVSSMPCAREREIFQLMQEDVVCWISQVEKYLTHVN